MIRPKSELTTELLDWVEPAEYNRRVLALAAQLGLKTFEVRRELARLRRDAQEARRKAVLETERKIRISWKAQKKATLAAAKLNEQAALWRAMQAVREKMKERGLEYTEERITEAAKRLLAGPNGAKYREP